MKAKIPVIPVREPKILFFDIETSFQTVAVFQLGGNDWINPENIIQERHMLSACWNWMGESKIHSVSLLDDPKRYTQDPHDDLHVVTALHKALSECDVAVAHYGDAFDIRYIKTRALKHGLDPLPPFQTIDTKKIAKSFFYFNSNSLDYLGKYLGLGGKIHTPGGLWMKILKGGPDAEAALKTMVVYNKRDVALLKDVFMKLRPYMPNHISRELFGHVGCPICGSTKIQSRGTYYAQTRTYRRFQCMAQGCKKWFRALKADKGSSTAYRVL